MVLRQDPRGSRPDCRTEWCRGSGGSGARRRRERVRQHVGEKLLRREGRRLWGFGIGERCGFARFGAGGPGEFGRGRAGAVADAGARTVVVRLVVARRLRMGSSGFAAVGTVMVPALFVAPGFVWSRVVRARSRDRKPVVWAGMQVVRVGGPSSEQEQRAQRGRHAAGEPVSARSCTTVSEPASHGHGCRGGPEGIVSTVVPGRGFPARAQPFSPPWGTCPLAHDGPPAYIPGRFDPGVRSGTS
jgi:hypothetical protein